jgi:uncharacterized protein involved in response to NO
VTATAPPRHLPLDNIPTLGFVGAAALGPAIVGAQMLTLGGPRVDRFGTGQLLALRISTLAFLVIGVATVALGLRAERAGRNYGLTTTSGVRSIWSFLMIVAYTSGISMALSRSSDGNPVVIMGGLALWLAIVLPILSRRHVARVNAPWQAKQPPPPRPAEQ